VTMFRIKGAPEYTARLVAYLVARSVLTDLSPGDPLMQVCGGVGVELEDVSLDIARLLDFFNLDHVEGEDLDARALEYLPDGFARRGGLRANGRLRWRTQNPVAVEVPIPAGAVAAKPGSPRVLYVTTVAGRIPVGSTQSERADGQDGDIPALAVDFGEAGDADVDEVAVIVTPVPNAVRVHNPVAFRDGRSAESDDDFRSRIRAETRSLSRCTPEALRTRVLQAEADGRRVRVAAVWEDPISRGNVTIYVDDGAGTVAETAIAAAEALTDPVNGAVGGEQEFYLRNRPVKGAITLQHIPTAGPVRVLVAGVDYVLIPSRGYVWLHPDVFPTGLDAGERLVAQPYTHFTGLIREAQRLVDGDPNDVRNYPTWRAAGVVTSVQPPQVVQGVVKAHIVVATDADRDAVRGEVRRRLSAYYNGLGIGAPWIEAEAIERAMAVAGMVDITFEAPLGNVPVAYNQVHRITSGNLTVL